MKILIVGSGSIGQRHFSNTIELIKDVEVIVVSRNKTTIEPFKNLKIVSDIAAAFINKEVYDAAIVATPTALHIQNCFDLINNGVKKIYVEKPVSHNLDKIEELINVAKSLNVLIYVGYDLRFDLGLNKVKELIEANAIGNTISVQAEVGQYLPDWRVGTNYKEGMSAKVKLGGGVMLDLIHEFDFLSWLLGPYKKIYGFNKKIESLAIETEGISVNVFETTTGVLGMLSLDYIQKELNRKSKFIGDFGTIEWDYTKSEVKWKNHNEKEWNLFSYKEIHRNDRFKSILNSFFEATKTTSDHRLTTIAESLISLKAVIDSKNT